MYHNHSNDPGADTPVEALIRYNISVHDSRQVRFLHGLMLVLMVGFGAAFAVMGVVFAIQGSLIGGVPCIVVGLFLMAWGPYARKSIAADTARRTAVAEWQLERVKAARLRDGGNF